MHIKELSIAEFDSFIKAHTLGSLYQSSSYALIMAEKGYEYDLIGFVDELGVIKAAALILIKKISLSYKYGYSPKGFVLDYFDYDLLTKFTEEIKNYYRKKLVFIKINPEIAIGEIDIKNKVVNYNHNIVIRDYLEEMGYKKLKDNYYFEALYPRFNGIINLQEYDFYKLNKNTRNKIRKGLKRGLVLEHSNRDGLDILYNFIKNKKNINEYYYKNYYNVFDKKHECDVFLIKIDYEKYLVSIKEAYEKELAINNKLSDDLIINSNETNINRKMNSDKALLAYKNDIEMATMGLRENKTTYVAGAFLIKYNNRVNIIVSGFDKKYKDLCANYVLHYEIIEYYKKQYKYLDLNGFTGDFNSNNPYKGLNEFKFGFKPRVYEFIGEYDFVIHNNAYHNLVKKGYLSREFNHK